MTGDQARWILALLPYFIICALIVGTVEGKVGLAAKGTRRQNGSGGSDAAGGVGDDDDGPGELHPEASLEAVLYQKLLQGYNRRIRPVKDHSKPINITVQMILTQVVDVNEKEQTLTTQVWLFEEWQDEYLSWNETDYPGVKYLVVPSSKIWIPDIWVTNILGDTHITVREFLDSSVGVEVNPSGKIAFWLPIYMQTFCPMRLKDFPFDVQKCEIALASWMYDVRQLKILPHPEDASEVSDYNPWGVSKQFHIQEFSHREDVTVFTESDRNYTYLYFELVLERKAFFFILNLLLPCYLLALIACLSYLLPPEGGDRIALLVTVFLSIVVFVLVVLEIVPEESDTLPLFSRFLLGVMILNMIQIVQAAFANMLHTSTTIRIPLPDTLNRFLKFTSCAKKDRNGNDTEAAEAFKQNGGQNQKNVILTEQGNSIANLNGNDKDGLELEGLRKRVPGETDPMLGGAGAEHPGAEGDERPDYTEDWKRFFLCLDKLCFITLVIIITIVFFYMIYF